LTHLAVFIYWAKGSKSAASTPLLLPFFIRVRGGIPAVCGLGEILRGQGNRGESGLDQRRRGRAGRLPGLFLAEWGRVALGRKEKKGQRGLLGGRGRGSGWIGGKKESMKAERSTEELSQRAYL